ncbi:hypothetical protein [Paucibacter sp. KCTC 42545]|nr:hypothetical protein [Paucibacter sp. KCTC 42545]
MPHEKLPELTEQLVVMVRMIVTGTQTLAISGSPDLALDRV